MNPLKHFIKKPKRDKPRRDKHGKDAIPSILNPNIPLNTPNIPRYGG
jgi:hypothetical protein